MAEDVGYYTMPVILSFDGVDRQVNSSLGKKLGAAGAKGGKDFEKQFVANAEAGVKRLGDTYVKQQDRMKDAAGKLRTEEAKLQELRDKGVSGGRLVAQTERAEKARRDEARAVKASTEAYKDLEAAQKKLDSGGSGGGFLDKLKNAASGAGSAGSEAASGFLDGFGGPIAELGSKAGPIGVALASAAALAVGAGGLIATQIMAGMELEAQQDKIQGIFGFDDATMAKIADASGRAYANNFGETLQGNMSGAAAAIQNGLVAATSSSDQIQGTVEQLSTVSTVLGVEIPEAARSAGQLIKTGFAKNFADAADLIVAGSQSGLNVSEDWLDTVNEYSTQFRKLGIDGPEALGLLSQAVQGGARDTDVAADAIKEFSIRAIDGSKSTMGAFHTLGLDFDATTDAFAKGGPAAHDMFAKVLTGIQSITDPYEKAQVQVALFGTQSEDLGDALNRLDLSNAAGQIGEVGGAAQRASDIMGGNTEGSVQSAMRTIEIESDKMKQSLATAFGPLVTDLANFVTTHKSEIIGFFTTLADSAIDFGQAVLTGIGPAAGMLGDLAGVFGLDDWAESLHGIQSSAHDAGEALQHGQDQLDAYADRAQAAAVLTDGLGSSVKSLTAAGENVTIDVKDDTPEVDSRLTALGIHLQEIEGDPTHLKMVADTDEAKRILDAYRAQQNNTPITPPVKPQMDPDALARIRMQLNGLTGTSWAQNGISGSGNPVVHPRLRGGIFDVWDQVASFADGKLPNQAMIQPPVAGGLVQWAEPRTGGEAFIPIDGGDRSRKIWAETGRRLNVFETGGFNGLGPDVLAAESLIGTKYSKDNRTDCSGMVARVISRALGLPEAGLMSTKNAARWLADRGFQPGTGGPGMISVGWYDHGPNPNDGHMAMTLSDGTNAEAGGSNSVFTLGAGAAGANDPKFDQHMFLPTLFGEGPAGSSSAGAGGSGGGGGGVAGTGPNGEAGTYSAPDAKSVREANEKIADADARVRQSELKLKELDADAKESQKQSAQADLDKAKREAADARTDRDEVMKGKFSPGGSSSGGGKGSGPQMSELGSIAKSFFTETFGLDGSWLPDIGNLMPLKMADTLLGAFAPADGGPQTSGSPFGIPDVMAPPMPPGDVHTGSGAPPGPGGNITYDLSNNYQGNVGLSPEEIRKQNERAQARGVARIGGIPMAQGN